MEGQDQYGEGGAVAGEGGEIEGARSEAQTLGDVHDHPPSGAVEPVSFPRQSPLYFAQHSDRYERQQLLRAYEAEYSCRLVVVRDAIFPESITYFEELVYEADPQQDLHLILDSAGGDGETAVRLVRSAQSRCRELTVIVPDQAKSAATLLTMGAGRILMGPTSDLGPVDPVFRLEETGELVSAKDIIAAVEAAERAVQERPETYPIHASLLENVTALMVQRARSAMARTDQVALQALRSNPERTRDKAEALWEKLKDPLAIEPADHSAVFDAGDAIDAGLPVERLDPAGQQWQTIWRLWTKYLMVNARIYEGRHASQILPFPPTTS